ncbi:MAG TPA: T9SS type A sorting domain-containing protein [Panacibacter sp.]|nr:T9SS type A sorting domain-containing protein [Panacibacter sp.]
MKRTFILLLLLVTYSNIFAFLSQGNWRWRKDDGNETTATWMAALNTAPTITSSSNVIRLRLEVNSELSDDTYLEDTLQYALAKGGPFININTTVGANAFVIAGSSAFVTDKDVTTQLLATPDDLFHPGIYVVSSPILNDSLPAGLHTEYEWCIRPTEFVKPNTVYYFRHTGAVLTNNAKVSLKTASTLPIGLANFTVRAEGKMVILEWTTATEQNNDRFDIERSADAVSWTKIASVKGIGASDRANNYKSQDNIPLNGNNYYRLKQYDKDGSFTVSDTRLLKMFTGNKSISVYPNPANASINLLIQNYAGNQLTATLSTLAGKMVHQEIIKVDQSATNYKLNLSHKPVPGLYMLQLKGENLSESIKVIVQ